MHAWGPARLRCRASLLDWTDKTYSILYYLPISRGASIIAPTLPLSILFIVITNKFTSFIDPQVRSTENGHFLLRSILRLLPITVPTVNLQPPPSLPLPPSQPRTRPVSALTLPSPPHSAYIDHRRERRFVEQFQTISRTFPLPAIHCKTPNCAFALARSSPPQTQPTGLRITVEYCSTANRRILQTLLGHLQAPIFRLVSTLRGKHDPVPGATALKRFSHTRRPSHRSQSFSTLLPFHKA